MLRDLEARRVEEVGQALQLLARVRAALREEERRGRREARRRIAGTRRTRGGRARRRRARRFGAYATSRAVHLPSGPRRISTRRLATLSRRSSRTIDFIGTKESSDTRGAGREQHVEVAAARQERPRDRWRGVRRPCSRRAAGFQSSRSRTIERARGDGRVDRVGKIQLHELARRAATKPSLRRVEIARVIISTREPFSCVTVGQAPMSSRRHLEDDRRVGERLPALHSLHAAAGSPSASSCPAPKSRAA